MSSNISSDFAISQRRRPSPSSSPPSMSVTTAFALWSCYLFILDSTVATSSWFGFLPISRDNFSQSSTLRLVWCSHFVVMITSQTHLQLCTGCACQSVWISRLLSWHFERCPTTPKPVGSCCHVVSPTSPISLIPTARPVLLTVNCRSPVVSSCCSHHMDLSPFGCTIIPVFIDLPSVLKNFSANSFLIYYYSTVFCTFIRFRGL